MKSLQLTKPHAIMVVGLPGSGKTYFASHFSSTFGAPFVNAPRIHSVIEQNENAAELTQEFLDEIVKTKQTFLYEPQAGSRVSRNEFNRFIRNAGYEPLIVWVQTDSETAKARSQRNGRSSQLDEELTRQFSPPHKLEKPIVISGKHTHASQARAVLTRISNAKPTRQLDVPPARTGRSGSDAAPSGNVHSISITRS